MNILNENFFRQNTLLVAKNLLGKILCRKFEDGSVLYGKIVETEAYTQEEESCHAFCGITKRSKTLFMQGGYLYVYFIYGMHFCANIVTENECYGSAVLIRAAEPLDKSFGMKDASGPAKLCRVFKITKDLNEINVTLPNSPIFLQDAPPVPENNIVQTERIGIKKAAELPWRFYIKDSKSVSHKKSHNDK